jgi:hypothetical protein
MADIIVRQANSTSLTVQASSNQVLVRQQPNNTVVVQTTGNSYVLPPATANTLGGIIVGDNLTINANGLLSAQAGGGVSTFNNRTGNVTLTANDVSAVGNALYFPLNANIVSGNATIAGQIDGFGSGNGTLNTRQTYGISKTNTSFGTEYQFAIGMNYVSPTAGSVIMARAFDTTNASDLVQSEIRIDYISATLVSTRKNNNGTLVSSGRFGASNNGATLVYQSPSLLCSMEVGSQGIYFFGIAQGSNNNPPGAREMLTKGAADLLYEKLVRRN